MFSWVKQEQGGRNKDGEMYQTVTEGLQSLYTKKLLPLEETYLFHDFHSPALEPADFQSKPMVLLVGQYSTGKTTFIRYCNPPPHQQMAFTPGLVSNVTLGASPVSVNISLKMLLLQAEHEAMKLFRDQLHECVINVRLSEGKVTIRGLF